MGPFDGDPSGVVLLDCTLRDGGYYNDWDFSHEVAVRYLRAMERSGMPVIEMGFRTLDQTTWFGAAGYTTDGWLESLEPASSAVLGAMVNAKELVAHGEGSGAAIRALFAPASESPLSLCRIATTAREVPDLGPAVHALRELGYRVGVNMMRIHTLDVDAIADFGRWCTENQVDVAYFADSLGCMEPSDITRAAEALKSSFDGLLGCHLHDNKTLAMANCHAAVAAGVAWVDGTIRGMGRGPGNARTEYLAAEYSHRGLTEVSPQALLSLVDGDFLDLHERYEWGPNLYYYNSALSGVHPTPVQRLLGEGRYSADEVLSAIEDLAEADVEPDDYDAGREAVEGAAGQGDSVAGWCEGREVLIVGAGDSVEQHREGLERFIEHRKPLVVMLNLKAQVRHDLVDAYAVSNRLRAVMEADSLLPDARAVYGPPSVLEAAGIAPESPLARRFSLELDPESSPIHRETGCTLPSRVVAAYAVALAAAGGASRVLTAGLDGFHAHDPRQAEMLTALGLESDDGPLVELVSVTPTSYPISERSLYSPGWYV